MYIDAKWLVDQTNKCKEEGSFSTALFSENRKKDLKAVISGEGYLSLSSFPSISLDFEYGYLCITKITSSSFSEVGNQDLYIAVRPYYFHCLILVFYLLFCVSFSINHITITFRCTSKTVR
jgi:hypothetical protein